MTITDLDTQVRGWALDEAGKAAFGENYRITVSWSLQSVQTPAGPVPMPAWMLLIIALNPIPAEGPLYHPAAIGAPIPVEAQVRQEVREGIKKLRDLAASKLAEANGGGKPLWRPGMPLDGQP